jgi:hypothetical protein
MAKSGYNNSRLVIAMLTVSFKCVQAALANPIIALKNE